MRIRARKLSKGSLFKLIFISTSVPFFLFFVLCGIASVFGAHTVRVNQSPVTGPTGLLAALAMYPIVTLLFSGFAWLTGAFGLWIYSKFRFLELELVDAEVVDHQKLAQP